MPRTDCSSYGFAPGSSSTVFPSARDIGDIILKNLENDKNIEKTLKDIIKQFNGKYSQDIICNTFMQLLGQINIEQFTNDTKPYIAKFNEVKQGLHIYLTEKCNLSCIHCYNAFEHPEKELSLDEFKSIIDFFAPHILKINISGGEPISSLYFFPLIEYINEKYPKIQLSLFTNGTFISSQEIANRINAYFEEVQVSINGASKEIVDFIRGKGAFDKITRALKFFNKPCTRRLPNTCSFGQSLIIDSNGDIYPCAFRKVNGNLGNFFDYEDKEKLLQDWDTCFTNHTVGLMKACKYCDIRYFCCGGCRLQHYNKTGFYAKETCDDKYKQKRIEGIVKDIKSRYSKETSIILNQKPIL